MFNFNDIEYYVNKEKYTVTAVIRNVDHDAIHTISRTLGSVGLPFWGFEDGCLYHLPYDRYMMPDTLVAVARCHPFDEWDEEVGKRVAQKKLFRHYNRLKANMMRDYAKRIQMGLDALEKKAAKVQEQGEK